MPTYEYRCPEGHEFELFQRMSDDPVAACPECGEAARRKISGGAGFLFKGEGFYITDYRSEEYRKKAAREQPGGKKDGSDKAAASGDSGSSASSSGSGSGSTTSSDSGSSSSSTD